MRLTGCCIAAFAFITSISAVAAEGDLDEGFGIAGLSYIHADAGIARAIRPRAAIELPDGKLLFAGEREWVAPLAPPFEPEIRGALMRLDADGTPDATFGNSGIPGLVQLPDLAGGLRVQGIEGFVRFEDGSLIATGTALVNGPVQGFVVKLDADGSIDPSFGAEGVVLLPQYYLHAVRIDAKNRIIVVGERFDSANAATVASIIRLLANGESDPAFGAEGIFSTGSGDATASGHLNDVILESDGSIVAGGEFEADGSGLGTDFSLMKVTPAGELDRSFAGSGWRVFDGGDDTSSKIERLVRVPGGAIAFAGFHSTGEKNRTGPIVGKVNANGETDETFGDARTPGYLVPGVLPRSAESAEVTSLVVQPDGKLIASISYYSPKEREDFVVIRASANGTLDESFAQQGSFQLDASQNGIFSEADALILQTDGRLVAAGRSQATLEILIDFVAVRLLTSSSDTIFADSFDGGASE